MALKTILLEDARTRQPSHPVGVDWDHPLVVAGGIFAVIDGANGVLYRKHRTELLEPVSGGTRRVGKSGKCLASGGGTSDGWRTPTNFDDLSGLTALSGFAIGSNSNSSGVLFGRWGTSANFGGFLVSVDSGQIFTLVAEASSGEHWKATRTAGFSGGGYEHGFSWSNNTITPYLNGAASVGSDYFTGAAYVIQTVGERLYINRHADSASGSTDAACALIILGNKDWPATFHRKIQANPWQIFAAEEIPLFRPVVTAQYARPVSDVSAGGWTASTGADLYAMLDETAADDGDYITSTTASTCEVALGSLSDPAVSTGHVVRYRISATGGGIIVRLREGSTTIASWTHDPAPGSLTTYEQTLSGGEADSITSYSALSLQFEAM